LQIEFRQIQKARIPELSTVEWLELFETWHVQYLALIEVRRARAFKRITAFIEQSARANPPAKPFKCVCGAETKDPFDPEYERIHREHIFLAQFDRPRQR
jgi:hypothetical protein